MTAKVTVFANIPKVVRVQDVSIKYTIMMLGM
jgi:hypothetical protein